MMAPGVAELSETAVHLVVHGDSAHTGGAGHEKPDGADEHGCSGSFHLCTCCHVTIVLSQVAVPFGSSEHKDLQASMLRDDVVDSGVLLGVFRPPIG